MAGSTQNSCVCLRTAQSRTSLAPCSQKEPRLSNCSSLCSESHRSPKPHSDLRERTFPQQAPPPPSQNAKRNLLGKTHQQSSKHRRCWGTMSVRGGQSIPLPAAASLSPAHPHPHPLHQQWLNQYSKSNFQAAIYWCGQGKGCGQALLLWFKLLTQEGRGE